MKILVTYFEPFGHQLTNSSKQICEQLDNVKTIEVKCCFNSCFDDVKKEIDNYHPDIILLTGQAASQKDITIEKYGYNLDDCKIADNDNVVHQNVKIKDDGLDILESTLDLDDIIDKVNQIKVSDDPGRFVCNHLLYETLYYVKKNDLPIKAGFIHFPLINENLEFYVESIKKVILCYNK